MTHTPEIKVIPATERAESYYHDGYITFQGITYRARRSRKIGSRGTQITARAIGSEYDRMFFVDNNNRVIA